MNYKQLIFAREYRGLNQTQLAESIAGLSQSNLSKFEKGFDTLSDDLKKKIIDFLDFPESFFHKNIDIRIENGNYRKKSAVRKSDILQFENVCKIFGYLVDEMSKSIEWADFEIQPLNVDEGYTPAYIANYVRRCANLKKGEPIKNIYTLLESLGIIIYEVVANEKFDGISFFSDLGYPLIVINKNLPNDRKRFTLAHEFGHILLHNESNFPISQYRDKEKEANEFASEFLMPEQEIKNSLRGIKIGDLGTLKSYWLTSMSSIIRRAKDLNCISPDRYKYFMIEMSRSGQSKNEKGYVEIDRPKYFEKGYSLLKEELGYKNDDFIAVFSLPEDVLNEVFNFSSAKILTLVK